MKGNVDLDMLSIQDYIFHGLRTICQAVALDCQRFSGHILRKALATKAPHLNYGEKAEHT